MAAANMPTRAKSGWRMGSMQMHRTAEISQEVPSIGYLSLERQPGWVAFGLLCFLVVVMMRSGLEVMYVMCVSLTDTTQQRPISRPAVALVLPRLA